MADNLFSENLAFSSAKFSSFEKGKEYFNDGLVEKIWKEGEIYNAIVKGNKNYQVTLRFENDELSYSCTCPFDFGGACKHVVAAILAFASEKKYSKTETDESDIQKSKEIKKLLKEATSGDLLIFLEKILRKEPELTEDLKIFLAGPKETAVTVSEYKEKFIKELNKLDMRELLEMWYREGDDYYDSDSEYSNFSSGDSLDETVSEFIAEGQKYEENNNIGEAMKIYQAIHDALDYKENNLDEDLADLKDAFDKSKSDVIDNYISVLTKTENSILKEYGINYLGSLFFIQPIHEDQIVNGMKNIICEKQEAEKLLSLIAKFEVKNLSTTANTLFVFLYQKAGQWEKFEKLSLNNLKKNPELVLDLLKFYQKLNKKEEIVKVANDVIASLPKKDSYDYLYLSSGSSNKDIELRIRRFIKNIYSPKTEYPAFINNLEWIFLLNSSLKDYEELVKNYQNSHEKEIFWQKMKIYFEKNHDIQSIFKIFKFENKKEDILVLLSNHLNAECFSEMITFVQYKFSEECFSQYKKKIDIILQVTDVTKYQEAVYHLVKMKKIGLENKFSDYINSIKTSYWRRRRLMEELKEHNL